MDKEKERQLKAVLWLLSPEGEKFCQTTPQDIDELRLKYENNDKLEEEHGDYGYTILGCLNYIDQLQDALREALDLVRHYGPKPESTKEYIGMVRETMRFYQLIGEDNV